MKPQIPHEIIDEEPVLVCPDCKVPLEELNTHAAKADKAA